MSKVAYLVTCYRAIKDELTQVFTYVDAFDYIGIPKGNDFIYQTFTLAGKIHSSINGQMKLEVSFEYPDQTKSSPQVIEGNIREGDFHFSTVFTVAKFTQPGVYYFRVKINGEDLETNDRFYFEVKKQE